MGLHANIYRDEYRSDHNVLGHVAHVTIINADGPFEPDAEAPAVMLKQHAGVVIAVPVFENGTNQKDGYTSSAGGSYIATSDSRFSEAVERLLGSRFYGAVPLHDYYQTWDEYERMSR